MYLLLGSHSNSVLTVAYRSDMGVQEFLVSAFERIRHTYSPPVGRNETWPTQTQLDILSSYLESSQPKFRLNKPSLARSIVSFIADPEHADPSSRLDYVVWILSTSPKTTVVLDALHTRLLSDIPPLLRSSVHRILAFLTCRTVASDQDWTKTVTARDISRFFNWDYDLTQRSLRMANLIVSKCPLLFSVDVVLDFHEQDSSQDTDYWWSASLIDSKMWAELFARYTYWINNILTTG